MTRHRLLTVVLLAALAGGARAELGASDAIPGYLLALRAYDAATAGNQWLCFDLVTPFDATSSGITINFAPAQLQFYIDTP